MRIRTMQKTMKKSEATQAPKLPTPKTPAAVSVADEATSKLQRVFNKDRSVTVYRGGKKIWRGSQSEAEAFVEGWFRLGAKYLYKDYHC